MSPGPRTPEGKAAAAGNATKFSLFSRPDNLSADLSRIVDSLPAQRRWLLLTGNDQKPRSTPNADPEGESRLARAEEFVTRSLVAESLEFTNRSQFVEPSPAGKEAEFTNQTQSADAAVSGSVRDGCAQHNHAQFCTTEPGTPPNLHNNAQPAAT